MGSAADADNRMKLGIFVTHPIQYFAPVWRALAAMPDLDLVVHFFSDHSIRSGLDKGFGVNVAWDVPMLDGYQHCFLSRSENLSKPFSVRMDNPEQLLRNGRFDAVMVHGYRHRFEQQVVRAARKLGIRVIMRGEFSDVTPYEGRGFLKSIMRNMYLARHYRCIDAFCYIGQEARLHLERRGISRDKMFFSPYAVDTELLEAQRAKFNRSAVRQEIGIPEDHTVLLFSGKLIPRKAPLLITEALRHIPQRDQLWLIVLGDGELKAEVTTAAHRVLGPRVTMPGFVNQSQIGKYFAAADIFILPSWFETWGLVVNEAMQFGLPVIASTGCGCHRDLIVPQETGLTFAPGDSNALAAGIQSLMKDLAQTQRMGIAARKRIALYTTDTCVEGIRRALSSDIIRNRESL